MRLSRYFHLRELTRSQVAARLDIDNAPDDEQVLRLRDLCANVLDPVRVRFGPFSPSSGFRSPDLNRAIGGRHNSQHMRGEAADFEVVGVPNLVVAKWISDNPRVRFDQLILEFYVPGVPNSGWVHCSYRREGGRREVLTAVRGKGYLRGLVP